MLMKCGDVDKRVVPSDERAGEAKAKAAAAAAWKRRAKTTLVFIHFKFTASRSGLPEFLSSLNR